LDFIRFFDSLTISVEHTSSIPDSILDRRTSSGVIYMHVWCRGAQG